MIFGIKYKCNDNFDPYNVLFYKYTRAAYDCFCAPGSHISKSKMKSYLSIHLSLYLSDVVRSCFLTQRHDQEAEVIQPIRRLVGQLSDEVLQH